MKMVLILIIAFLIILYVYNYIKHKKRKAQTIDTVGDFHKKYLQKNNPQNENINKDNDYTKFITKYNSKVDYVEKDKFMDS